MQRNLAVAVLALFSGSALGALRSSTSLAEFYSSAHHYSAGAPGAAPAAAPGGAPGPAGPPAPTDSWGADTHAEEFGKEYIHHTREGLKEPHVGDAAWMSEIHSNVANFDPHGRDFLTDGRSPAKFTWSGAGHTAVSLIALLPGVLFLTM